MYRIISLVFGPALLCVQGQDFQRLKTQAEREIFMPGKTWELLGQGYQLTADSAVDKAGNVYFTDSRRNRILKIDLSGKISTWKEDSNGSHVLRSVRTAVCMPVSMTVSGLSLSRTMVRSQ